MFSNYLFRNRYEMSNNMQNMIIIDETHIQTPNGIFGDVVSFDVYPSGELKSVVLNGKNVVLTHAGELIPAYQETMRRKYKPSVEFYINGMIKAISLDEQQELNTPIGDFPAELITFYDTGEVKRVFPLDGKISGFWGEEDEKNLNIPFNFDLGITQFNAMLNGICFYKSGEIRSITLYPKEEISVNTTFGQILVRNGFSLYETGELMSLEPATTTSIKTPIGTLDAYDSNAVGINADSNSLNLSKAGELTSLISMTNRIGVQTEEGGFVLFGPKTIPAVSDEEDETYEGIKLSFSADGVRFNDEKKEYNYKTCGFTIMKFQNGMPTCSPSDCASCSLCKK